MVGKNRPSSNPNLSIEITMIMKKIFLFAAFAAVLAGCSDDITTNPSEPVKPGSDITFGISLSENPQSRTMYGSETNDAFPVYWVNDEQILVASPQCAAGRTLATYKVSVDNAESNTATAVTKVSEAGVQWGETLPANFYSIYPVGYTATAGKVENKITNNTDNAVAHLNVRDYQRNVFTLNGNKWEGVPVDRADTLVEKCQKYPDALMYAQTKMGARGDVMLQFNPFTVAFNITLDGYELATTFGNTDPGVTIEEIIITAPSEVHLAGNFDATFDATCASAPVVNTEVNTLATRNVIHIPTLLNNNGVVKGSYLTIKKDQSLSFNVFAIPTDNTVSADWTITVRTLSGVFTHKLAAATDKSADLVPGYVHKLTLPKFRINNEFNFEVEKWMAQIPRNVYITELSVPGAWYGTQAEYQGRVTYESLWKAGVRAFGLETRSSVESRWDGNRTHVVVSGTGSNSGALSGHKYIGGTPIVGVIRSLIEQVKAHEDEYAILVLSYADGGDGGHRKEDYTYWLKGIFDEYNALDATTEKPYIYSDEITANTTIADVKGKLIIKVNVGGGLPGRDSLKNIQLGDYGNKLPGLFSFTNMAWNTTDNTAPISQLYWKEWNNDWLKNVTDASNTEIMYWNYTFANRTQLDTGTNTSLPHYKDRKAAITSILANSKNMYASGKHNIWFYVGAGGNQATKTDDDTNASTAKDFAKEMNEWIKDQLVGKINAGDFSPFGMVMCNYITGDNATYFGKDIIDNIIKMNRLFRLNRDESQPEWPTTGDNNNNNDNTNGGGDTSSQSKSAGSFSVDTDNWEVF